MIVTKCNLITFANKYNQLINNNKIKWQKNYHLKRHWNLWLLVTAWISLLANTDQSGQYARITGLN